MKTNLIVGAGISGATIANLIATKLGERVLVIDRRNHIAGNCYDYRDKNGIMIQKYGSHIFHTSNEKVWRFVLSHLKIPRFSAIMGSNNRWLSEKSPLG